MENIVNKKEKVDYKKKLIGGILGFLFILASIFLIAGRINYWQGWVFSGTLIIYFIIQLITMENKEELFKERVKPGSGQKWWDKLFFAISTPSFIAVFFIGALDGGRFSWTKQISSSVFLISYIIFICSLIILGWSMRVNRWFSTVVRIQDDRGQQVVQVGPYGIVRHPGYVAAILMCFGTALVLGSLYALIPAFLVIISIIIRTYLEDKTLQKELIGYADYVKKVKYRLIPGIW